MPRQITVRLVDVPVSRGNRHGRPAAIYGGRRWVPLLGLMGSILMIAAILRSGIPGTAWILDGMPVQSLELVASPEGVDALVFGRFKEEEPFRLAFLRSSNLGASFESPHFIETGSEEIISNRRNSIRLNVDGDRIIAVYAVRGPYPGYGPLRIAVSKDAGRTFISGIQPVKGDPLDNQSYPALIRDRHGVVHLFWLDDREEAGSSAGLRTARSMDDGLTWQDETTLDEKTCTCCDLAVSNLGNDDPGLLYRDENPRDMKLIEYQEPTDQWRVRSVVGDYNWQFEGCPHAGGALNRLGDQLDAVVWTGHEEHHGLHFLHSMDLGAHWQIDHLLDAEGTDPELGAFGRSNRVVAFRHGSGPNAGISVIESHDGGHTWLTPKIAGGVGLKSERPRVIADAGGYRVFWTEGNLTSGKRVQSYYQSWSQAQ